MYRSDFPKMEYLTMTIKESLRLYSPVFWIGRTLDQSTTFKSKFLPNQQKVTLPKDLDVIVNINVHHRNEDFFENPTVN